MAELKTKQTGDSCVQFLDAIEDKTKREDCFRIAGMMKGISKHEPKMWGTAIVGFGNYHYKYESGHEGDMCMIGFSPRKKNIALYLMGIMNTENDLLAQLGKHATGKGCLYINKLADVDTGILEKLIKASFTYVKDKYK